jgi:hypothetical protein
VALPVLRGIRFIPVEAGTGRKRVILAHVLYISHVYFARYYQRNCIEP